jgi:diguanylate cyclase (GGDEF)-like protein
MKCIYHLGAAILCAFASLLFLAPLAAQQYTFRQYGPSDGLTNLGVNCLFQDHTGYLWVGTDNGLFRYDGTTFQLFGHGEGLEDTEIRSVAESPDGNLWVATQNGVVRRSGSRFIAVDAGAKGLFLAIAFDPRGNLYLEHSTGILRGVPESGGSYRFTMVAPGSIGGMFVEGSNVWFRRDGDLWRLNGEKTERVGLAAGLPSDRWGSITLDTLGNLWVRSATRLFELLKGQTRFIDRTEGIPNAMVTRLFADAHGRLYVSTSAGLVMLDSSKDSNVPSRTYIDPQHGLPSDVAGSVLVDREESLWIGMRGGGLVRRLGHGEWLAWKKADGLSNDSVWSVLHNDDGRLWVGTNGGLNVFAPDGKVAHTWNAHSGLTGDSVYAIAAAPSGQVFVGTAPIGVDRFSPEGLLLRSYGPSTGLASEQVNGLAIDHQNRLWVAAAGGCFRSHSAIDSLDLKFDHLDIPGVPSGAYCYEARVDENGTVWITTSSGLARYDGSRWRVFTKADGLKADDLVALTIGHGQFWIAYRDALGISRLEFHGDRVQVSSVTQQDGLSSDLIYALALDRAGHLWVSTDNGVSVLEDGRWRHYGMEDGLIWDDGNDHALSIDSNDSIWIGTSRGLSRYAPLPFPIPDIPSAVVLTMIQGASREYQSTDKPVLSHAQNSLLIRFSGLNYSSETRTLYRYRLLGSKSSWSETREKSVHFEDLAGGDYVFEVIAAGPNGLWSPTPARFAFTVKPPWWLTWWFLSACVIVVLLLASMLWHYRVRVLVAQKEYLEQQVIERTAELRESHRQLEEIAYYDVLTSLPNRRMFNEQFRSRLAISRRHGAPFALLLVDLDRFKRTNDTFGHDAGDAVLIESGKLLREAVRESDFVARLGGDEYAILLLSPTDPGGIEAVCERVMASFAAGIAFNNSTLSESCSVGVAVFPADGNTQERLYKSADMALYEAKRMGGNSWRHYREELSSAQAASGKNEM